MRSHISGKLSLAWNSPTITAWSAFAVTALNFLLLLPLAMRVLAPAEFAVWLLFATVANLQSVLSFGLVPTFTRLVAYAFAGRNVSEMATGALAGAKSGAAHQDALRRIMGATHSAFIVLAVVGLLAGSLLGTWLFQRPIGFVTDERSAWVAWGVFLLGNTATMAGTGFAVLLMGANRVALVQRWQTIFGILSVLSSAVALGAGSGLLGVTLAGQFFACLTVVRNWWLCGSIDEGTQLRKPCWQFDRAVWTVTWGPSWRSGVANLVYYGYVQLSGLLYAQLGSAVSVASYVFTLRLVQVVSSFSQAPFYSQIPRLAFLHGSGDGSGMLTQAYRGMRGAYWVYGLGILGLFTAAEPALALLGKGQYQIDRVLLLILSLGVYFERVAGMNMQLAALTNRVYSHISASVTSLIGITVVLLGGARWGAQAFAGGILLGQLGFQSWYAVRKASGALQVDLWPATGRLVAPPFFLILCAAAVAVAVHN